MNDTFGVSQHHRAMAANMKVVFVLCLNVIYGILKLLQCLLKYKDILSKPKPFRKALNNCDHDDQDEMEETENNFIYLLTLISEDLPKSFMTLSLCSEYALPTYNIPTTIGYEVIYSRSFCVLKLGLCLAVKRISDV